MKETFRGREVAPVPTEGKWFRVNPLDINLELFMHKKADPEQERTRCYILEAFDELLNDSSKISIYARPFYTMIPKKTWLPEGTCQEFWQLASALGDHNANWVEQALERAQRIHNGESWDALGDYPELVVAYAD